MAHATSESAVAFPNAPGIQIVGMQVLLAIHAVLQLLDLGSTYLALASGGVEANPVSRNLIEGGGWLAYGGIKVLVASSFLALWPVAKWMQPAERRMVFTVMTLFAIFMAFVVVNNALIAF